MWRRRLSRIDGPLQLLPEAAELGSALDFDHDGPQRHRRRIGYAGLADGKGQQPAPAHVTGGCFDFRRAQIPCAAYRQMRLECRGSVSPRESSDQAPQHLLLISGRLQPNRSGHPAPRQTPSLRTDAISRIATGSMRLWGAVRLVEAVGA